MQNIGTVKWFNDVKGFGFIIANEKPDGDVMVHHRAIEMEGYRTLTEGDQVEFETTKTPQGLRAVWCRKISGPDVAPAKN